MLKVLKPPQDILHSATKRLVNMCSCIIRFIPHLFAGTSIRYMVTSGEFSTAGSIGSETYIQYNAHHNKCKYEQNLNRVN